jgi:hypothetical protein
MARLKPNHGSVRHVLGREGLASVQRLLAIHWCVRETNADWSFPLPYLGKAGLGYDAVQQQAYRCIQLHSHWYGDAECF